MILADGTLPAFLRELNAGRNMTLSAFVFYVSNMVIVSGYLFAALQIARRRFGPTQLRRRARASGLAFFLLCGLTHLELALHAAIGDRIVTDTGGVDWHMHAIHIPQAFSIWLFLWAMWPAKSAPLEGAAAPPPEPDRP